MPLFLLNKWVQGAIALLILAFLLDWYTDGKVKDAFVDFGNKEIELIKEDKNAVDKVDDNIGDGSILDGLLGVQPEEDTSNGQERIEIYSGEISYSDPEEADDERIYADSGDSIAEELSFFGIPEHTEESAIDTDLLQKNCTAEKLLELPNNLEGCRYQCEIDNWGVTYWGEVCE